MAFLRKAQEGHIDNIGAIRPFTPFSAKTRRTEAVIERNGTRLRVMKGALRTIAAAAGLDEASISQLETKADERAKEGFRVIAVGRAEGNQPLRLVGLALLADAPRPDSRHLIDELRALGVSVKMLSGDALAVAREIGATLGLDGIIRAPELRTADAVRPILCCNPNAVRRFPKRGLRRPRVRQACERMEAAPEHPSVPRRDKSPAGIRRGSFLPVSWCGVVMGNLAI